MKNIDRNTEQEDLKDYFDQFGRTTKVKQFQGRQIAFVEYEKHEDAMRAKRATDNTDFEGSTLQVDFSGDKPNRDRRD